MLDSADVHNTFVLPSERLSHGAKCFLQPSHFCLASASEAPAPSRLVNHCIGSNPNAAFQFDSIVAVPGTGDRRCAMVTGGDLIGEPFAVLSRAY